MKMGFPDAMRAATEQTRALNPMEATRIIQSALLLGREPFPADGRNELQADDRAKPDMIDIKPEVDVTEPEPMVRAETLERTASRGVARFGQDPIPPLATNVPRFATELTPMASEFPRFSFDGLPRSGLRKPIEVPDGACYLARSYRCAAGRRDYKLYVPSRLSGGCALLVMLHGARRTPMTSRREPA